jgi:xanthine dehydrogenase small subunit
MGQIKSETKTRDHIVFYLNGRRIEVRGADALKPLAHLLRYQFGLPGTKVVCSEGDCGACTVLIAPFRQAEIQKFRSINACIAPAYSLDLCHVVTVEGLAIGGELSTVQQAMVDNHGGQCGYCTPGFVCAMTVLAEDCLAENKIISEKRARNYLTGNLCRCTGYEPILKAATAIELDKVISLSRYVSQASIEDFSALSSFDILIQDQNFELNMPGTLTQAVRLKKQSPELRIVGGATDLGVLLNKDKLKLVKVMSLAHVSELEQIQHSGNKIVVGATVTLATLESVLRQQCSELQGIIKVFASPQIKNAGTLVGNVVNASPIADTIPALMVLEGKVIVSSGAGARQIPITEFYKGYKQLDLAADEIVTHIEFEIPSATQVFKLYKVAPRKDLDISVVTCALLFTLKNKKIEAARLAFGGVGPTVLRLSKLEAKLIGQDFSSEVFVQLGLDVEKEIAPISDLRGTKEFRLQLAKNLLKKCYREVSAELGL